MTGRPNIIIFNPDQMRADAMGHMGNPAAKTPFLDAMANTDAVSFSHAFCQNPVCVPSRCSFTTGLYPHVNGHRTMSYMLRAHETSIFKELKDTGYYVWMNARNDLIAGQIPGLMEQHASEIYYGGGPSADAPGPEADPRGEPGSKDYYSFYHGRLKTDADGKNYNSDDEDVDAAIRCIQNKPADQPLCLFLGLVYPHPPYQVEEPYFSAIDRKQLPKRIRPETCEGKPELQSVIRGYMGMEQYTEEDWDELRACYLGMCMKVDAQFQRLCEALKAAGEYDNSAIFFFSDHGDFTGDYGLPEKAQNSFEDCLTNVPLLVKPPAGIKVDAGICDGLTELVDFYATAMDFAGVTPSHTHYGTSLRPMLEDRQTPGRTCVTCEGGRNPEEIHCDEYHDGGHKGINPANPYWPRLMSQTDPDVHVKGYMIRTQDWKLVSRVNGRDELYHLTDDPHEQHNLFGAPGMSEITSELKSMQMMWLMRTADAVPFDFDSRSSTEMVWAKVRRLVPPEYEAEIRQRIAEGANVYSLYYECRARFKNI